MPCFLNRAALFGALCTVLLGACSGDNPQAERRGPPGRGGEAPIPSVEVVEARFGALPLEERLTGRVIARNQTAIFPEVSGPIVEVLVDNGTQVQAGDPLVRIRDSEYRELYQQAVSGLAIAEAQTSQARANLQLLRSQQKRTEDLAKRQLDSQAALDDIRAQVAVAEANVQLRQAQEAQARSQMQERKRQLDYTVVRAPVDGWVGQRNAERGQQVSSSSQLFIIGDLSRVQIEVPVTEKMLSYLKEGTPVEVRSDSWNGTVLESEIARISPFLNANTLRTQAYVELENAEGLLRSGMFVNVDVLYGNSEQAVLVPNNALYRHPRTGEQGVFRMQAPSADAPAAGDASETTGPVMTAARDVNFVPIKIVANGRMVSGVSGLQAGDWVVTVGKELLMGDSGQARARVISWDRMMEMQRAQSRDLFELIDQRQRAE